jgi:hypothetical protein
MPGYLHHNLRPLRLWIKKEPVNIINAGWAREKYKNGTNIHFLKYISNNAALFSG